MRNLLICLLLMAILLPAAKKKGKSPKPPEVTLLSFEAKRVGGDIEIDGVVRINAIEKPLRGLRLKLELFAPNKELMSKQNIEISEEVLEEGDEVPFYVGCRDHARTVHLMVEFRSKKRMYLRLENPGPYPLH
jgi:hypothetical protein